LKRSFVLALLFAAAPTAAQEEKLISGPGALLTENQCKICHELQHIRRAQLSAGEWADNLRNMKERGAPMSDAEMQIIHRYLSTYYNREKPAPRPSEDTLAGGDAAEKLLNANGCTGCHAVDRKIVGPAFREVAQRYSAADAARLAAKIRDGSQGAWGPVPMPPNAGVATADAEKLAGWVLEQK